MYGMVEGKVRLMVMKSLHSDALLEPISLRLLVNNASDGGFGRTRRNDPFRDIQVFDFAPRIRPLLLIITGDLGSRHIGNVKLGIVCKAVYPLQNEVENV